MKDKTLHVAMTQEGRPLPFSSEQVQQKSREIIDRGTLIAVVSEIDGEMTIQVIGEPSRELAETLRMAADAYDRYLGRVS